MQTIKIKIKQELSMEFQINLKLVNLGCML